MTKLPDWFKKVKGTPKQYTKPVKYGKRKYTAINSQYQILKATEIFGLYGSGWGVRALKYDIIRDQANKPVLMTLDAEFFYVEDGEEGVFEISTDINFFEKQGDLNSDMRKKLLTDLTTKALSKIGFNSDVFLGMYDDEKYVAAVSEEPLVKPDLTKSLLNNMVKAIGNAKTESTLLNIENRFSNYTILEIHQKQLNKLIDDKKTLLQKG